jgi:hypothetical protein
MISEEAYAVAYLIVAQKILWNFVRELASLNKRMQVKRKVSRTFFGETNEG